MSAYPSSLKSIKHVKSYFTFIALLFLSACGGGGGGGGTTITSASSAATSSSITTSSSSTSSSAVSVAPILSDVRLDQTLSGFITAGATYSGKVVVTPIDSRNSIVSYKIQNPTVLGGIPTINSQGEVQWIPNDLDINTKSLKMTVVMKEGAEQSVELPVSVHVSKQLFEIELTPDQIYYSDADGAVNLLAFTKDGSPLTGKIKINEFRGAEGGLSYSAIPDNEKVIVKFLEVPTQRVVTTVNLKTQSEEAAEDLTADITLKLGLSGAGQKANYGCNFGTLYTTRPVLITDNYYLGCNYATDTSYRETRTWEPEHNLIQVDGTCSSASSCKEIGAPIILIHGFNPFNSIGGGDGTWGTLASALKSSQLDESAKHDVFEFRWITHMRFEEAAGQLAVLINKVSEITGKKPIIIAHSFGGVVSHLALSNQGVVWRNNQWESQKGVAEKVSRLITLGSPISGVSNIEKVDFGDMNFVKGRDSRDFTISKCVSITCVQAGAFDLEFNRSLYNVLSFSRDLFDANDYSKLTVLDALKEIQKQSDLEEAQYQEVIKPTNKSKISIGESIYTLHKVESHSVSTSIVVGIVARTNFADNKISDVGDRLISVKGQIHPKDSAEITNKIDLNSVAKGTPGKMFSLNGLENRNYFFLGGGVHTSAPELHYQTSTDIKEALYEGQDVEYCADQIFGKNLLCDNDAIKTSKSHLWTFNSAPYNGSGQIGLLREPVGQIPDSIKTKSWKSPFNVVSVCDSLKICTQSANGIAILPLTIELRNKSTGGVVSSARFYTDAEGFVEPDLNNFIDTKADGFNRADYKIQITLGDGVTYDIKKVVVDDITADVVQVPDIVLQKKGTAGTGTLFGRALDKANQPLANIQVRLKAGINLGAGDFTNIAPSTTARIVKTDANGYFSVSGLRATEFSAEFISARTKHKFDSGIIVPSGSSLTKDFILEATYCDSPFVLKNGGCTNSTPVTVPIPEFVLIPGKDFSMSKYETTFAEYDAYAEETGSAKPFDAGWGRGNRPVINVSWNDAVAYAAWLSKKTGNSYGLPTQEQWEFSAKAGVTTNFPWGNTVGTNNANCLDCGSAWDNKQTAPVGSFKPNNYGLFDMQGNIFEWTSTRFYNSLNNEDVSMFIGSSWNSPIPLPGWGMGSWPIQSINPSVGIRLVQDFTENNLAPQVFNVTHVVAPNSNTPLRVGERATFEISGKNLPANDHLDISFGGCANIEFVAFGEGGHVFYCTPQVLGDIFADIRLLPSTPILFTYKGTVESSLVTPKIPKTPLNPAPGNTTPTGPLLGVNADLHWLSSAGADGYSVHLVDLTTSQQIDIYRGASELTLEFNTIQWNGTPFIVRSHSYAWSVTACLAGAGCSPYTEVLRFHIQI